MSTYEERREAYDFVDRNVKRASGYVKKASQLLYAFDEKKLAALPTSYWTLLDALLATAVTIIEKLPDEFFATTEGVVSRGRFNLSDEPLAAAKKVVDAFTIRRAATERQELIAKLENTTGRTPEEAAGFKAKADELRKGGV